MKLKKFNTDLGISVGVDVGVKVHAKEETTNKKPKSLTGKSETVVLEALTDYLDNNELEEFEAHELPETNKHRTKKRSAQTDMLLAVFDDIPLNGAIKFPEEFRSRASSACNEYRRKQAGFKNYNTSVFLWGRHLNPDEKTK